MQTLTVDLGERSYPIHIGGGLIDRADLIVPHLRQPRAAIVTNTTVGPLYLERLQKTLAGAGVAVIPIVLPDGEAYKNWETLNLIFDALLKNRAERKTTLIALGGGVIGDLTGFAAASYQRGVPFIQVPTTLLAQVDSSVGGKTGINTPQGKNLAGAFHQPRIVLADTGALATLPLRELRAGWAEVAKHGLLQGPLFAWCEAEGPAAVAGDAERLAVAVLESCRLKAGVVAADEREESPEGGRALLNLGHTFGHAIEAEFGFDGTLLHGEAVAVGLPLAARLSARLGHADPGLAPRIEAHLQSVGLPARLADLPRIPSASALLARMKADKKAREGRLHILAEMAKGLSGARTAVAAHAPKITTITIPKDKIREVIGTGGKVIREIVEKTGAKINIEDDGSVKVASASGESIKAAIKVHETPEWIDTNWERQPLWEEQLRLAPVARHSATADLGFCARSGDNLIADIPLRTFRPDEAARVIDMLTPYQQQFRASLGYGLVYPSDEFYLLAGRDVPPAEVYDGCDQIENGVGMVRQFLDQWEVARHRLPPRVRGSRRVIIVTGALAAPVLRPVVERLNRVPGLTAELKVVRNDFFGDVVTVAGLLTAGDVSAQVAPLGPADLVILPRVMFDYKGERTIDDQTPAQIAAAIGSPVAMAREPGELVRLIRAVAKAAPVGVAARVAAAAA